MVLIGVAALKSVVMFVMIGVVSLKVVTMFVFTGVAALKVVVMFVMNGVAVLKSMVMFVMIGVAALKVVVMFVLQDVAVEEKTEESNNQAEVLPPGWQKHEGKQLSSLLCDFTVFVERLELAFCWKERQMLLLLLIVLTHSWLWKIQSIGMEEAVVWD